MKTANQMALVDLIHKCITSMRSTKVIRQEANDQIRRRYASDRYRIVCKRQKEPGTATVPGSKSQLIRELIYSMIVETMPEPTVWPPSRIAKRRPSSMAIG